MQEVAAVPVSFGAAYREPLQESTLLYAGMGHDLIRGIAIMAKGNSGKPKRRSRKPSKGRPRDDRRRSTRKSVPLRDIPTQLDHARRQFMVTRSVRGAARSTGVSESQLRRLIRNYRLAKWDRSKRKWKITDRVTREVGIASNGRAKAIVVRGFLRAQLAKGYTAAVKYFLDTNDVAALAPYEGQSITDIDKKEHILETRPNVLLRLANTGGDAEMKIYRLID
jgi:hypothetical protein